MTRRSCENCGCAEYNGVCTNCHESLYILQQYDELGLPPPAPDGPLMHQVAREHADVVRKGRQKP
jgi:hypothetical protein